MTFKMDIKSVEKLENSKMRIERVDISNKEKTFSIKEALVQSEINYVFLTPEYLRVIRDTYSYRAFYLTCFRNGDLCGIVSFYEKPGLLKKNVLVSVPGGFWSTDRLSEKILIDKLNEIADNYDLGGPYFGDLFRPLYSLTNPIVMYRSFMQLPENKESLMGLYAKSIRRNIRAAKKHGLKVMESNELGDFYKVWSQRMRDLGTPVIPSAFFMNMKRVFKDDMALLLVKKEGKCIGGVVLLQFNNVVMDPYVGCLSETFKYCPNPLLYHEMLSWALDRGYEYFDLGRSQPSSGNERFKLRFGAKLKPLYSYSPDRLHINSPLRKISTSCWKRLPLFMANYLGPKIRRYVPFG